MSELNDAVDKNGVEEMIITVDDKTNTTDNAMEDETNTLIQDDKTTDNYMEDDDETNVSLDTLPVELLLHILQYLEVRYITSVVARVCTYFQTISNDQSTWKIRMQKRWPWPYPACPPTPSFNWTEACICREEESHTWRDDGANMTLTSCPTAHYASVDAVIVTDDLVISGSRDRAINAWNIGQVQGGVSSPVMKMADAHKGWVWTFCRENDLLVSGSWDNSIKFWNIANDGIKEARAAVNLRVSVLASSIYQNRIAAGTFDKKVIQFDAREDVKKMTCYKVHKKPVLAVKVTEKHVLSLSEDGKLVVFDRKAARKYKSVDIPGDSYPLSMSLHDNVLYVGDKTGGLHLIDTTHDSFDLLQSYNTGHTGRLTSIHNGLGCVMTGSSDGSIKVFHPGKNLNQFSTIKNADAGEVAQISYQGGILAGAFSNNTVKIWTPSN